MITEIDNGAALPTSAQDMILIKSAVYKDLGYKIGVLTYRGRTKIQSDLLRGGFKAATQDDLREELERALPHITTPEVQESVLSILALGADGEQWSDTDQALLENIETQARKRWPPYAALYADRHEANREYAWLLIKYTLRGFEGTPELQWEVDFSGLPTDACLELIPERDITKIVVESDAVSKVDDVTAKNSDSPS